MNYSVASALLAMSTTPFRDEAQIWANEAHHRGATPEELAQAWEAWDREADGSVHMVDLVLAGSEPSRCRCSHARATHSQYTGDCWSAACGCARFEKAEGAA